VVGLHVASGIYPRLPFLPGFQAARDLGVTMFGTLLVWWASLRLPATSTAAPTPDSASGATVRVPGVGLFK
jgi:hypothetical protein